jgi:lysophospholipase L1-like esterase
VNNEIEVFTRKLRKQLKVFNNASLIEVNSERDQFTRYGLHLNSKGKDQSAKKIVNTVKDILKENKG